MMKLWGEEGKSIGISVGEARGEVRGEARGEARGIYETTVALLRNVMSNNISFDEACRLLGIEDKDTYKKALT